MAGSGDSDLHLGQIAVRMGLIAPKDLPRLLQEARSGHTEESAGGGSVFAQMLLRKQIVSVSDYMYMARQARDESASDEDHKVKDLQVAFHSYESGELDMQALREVIAASGEPLVRSKEKVQRFARYELLEEIARGGMGIVYKARDTSNDQILALKVMIEADDDEIRLARFEREAELAAALDHPHIVKIHDAGREEGMPYFTMDLIHGDSLDDLLEGDGVPRDLALQALAHIARAMDHAHQRGIVHRDLKPGNILIERKTGIARITDFGLARDLHRGTRLTMVGQAVGTPYYMAPEQVRGERDVDGRCDVYALGVMIYEVLTGDVPFDADSPLSLFKKIDREDIELPLDPEAGIDEGIRAITLRAVARDREERYSRGNLLADDLERYLSGQAPRAQPYDWREAISRKLLGNRMGLLAVGLAALALLILGIAGGIAHSRMSARRQVESALGQLDTTWKTAASARDQSRKHLSQDEPGSAREQARAGLDALEGLGELLGRPGVGGEAARESYEERGGSKLQDELLGLLGRAWLTLARKDPAAASEATAPLESVVARLPRNVRLRLELADLLRRLNDPARALGVLSAALEIQATNEEALVARGRVYLDLGRPEKAASDLSNALQRRADDVGALIARSRAYLALGRLEAARQDASQARDLAANRPEPNLACGDVARAQGKPADAFRHYRRAARLAPDSPLPHLRTGAMLIQRGSFEDALKAYGRAAKRGGGWRAHLGRGRAQAFLFRLEPAQRELLLALKACDALPEGGRGPAQAAVLTLRGELLLANDEVDEARQALTKAVQVDPRAVAARIRLARMALDLDQAPAKAKETLRGLPQGAATDPNLLAIRSRIALGERQIDRARSVAERAVATQHGGRHPRARRALARARVESKLDDAACTACEAAWSTALAAQNLVGEYLRRSRELVALAVAYHNEWVVKKTLPLLRAVLHLDSQSAPAWSARAQLYASQKKSGPAWEAYKRAHDLDPFQAEVAEGLCGIALRGRSKDRVRVALQAIERAIRFQEPTTRRLILQARCQMFLKQWKPALETLDRAARLDPTRPRVQELRVVVLKARGQETGARLAKKSAEALGPKTDKKRRWLFKQALAVESNNPQKALDYVDEAIRLSDPGRHKDLALMARFRAGLVRFKAERIRTLAPTLTLSDWRLLDLADKVLAKVWKRPLNARARRLLLTRTQESTPAALLSVALAAVYDGLAGSNHSRWMEQALVHAQEAVRLAPASLPAHIARAYLRIHTGDPARGLRELLTIQEAASDSGLYQFVLAEAASANGNTRLRREALARARSRGIPSLRRRIEASPFLKEQ